MITSETVSAPRPDAPARGLAEQAAHVLIRSQILMALSAVSFLWICTTLLGRALRPPWYLAAFVGCWWAYIADANGPAREDLLNIPERVRFFARYRLRLVLIASLLSVAALVWLWIGVDLKLRTFYLLAVLAALALAYAFPLLRLPGGLQRRLKEFDLLKPAIVSLAWIAGGILLPLVQAGDNSVHPAVSAPVLCGFMFLLLLGDSVALDWRDRLGDRAHGILTLAVRLGRFAWVLFALVLAGAALLWWFGASNAVWRWTAGDMLLAHALSLALCPAARRRPLLFYSAIAAWRFAGIIPLLIFR